MNDNETALIREALRHAEVKQASLLQVALAADTRAMSLSVACAGISGVLLGIDAAGEAAAVSASGLITAATFFVAACLSGWAARPMKFALPGQDFSDFEADLAANRGVGEVMTELAKNLDKDADENQIRLNTNAWFFKAAMALAAFAPLVGMLTALCS